MAFDEGLAERIREIFIDYPDIVEKKMFGGIAFMMSGNMCCGVIKDTLMARVGPEHYQKALSLPHAREMDFTGKTLKGFVYVDYKGIESDSELEYWVSMCEMFIRTMPVK